MNRIRCLLVDDEPPAIQLLEKYTGMIDQLEVAGTSYSAVKAFEMLKDNTIDLLFLDIQMPVLNGIDFIKTLQAPPAVILTTAHREYALDGYDLDIIDYLLKPFTFERFLRAVDRYRQRTTKEPAVTEPAKLPDHIFFNVNRTQHKVLLSDIRYIESLKDYVRIHTAQGRLVVKGNIGSILRRLPVDRFIRIHRSFAVALSHITSYNQSELEVGGQSLPIGISFKRKLDAKVEESTIGNGKGGCNSKILL